MENHSRRINRTLTFGWLLTVAVLFALYALDAINGRRSVTDLLTFLAVSAVPAAIVLIRYLQKPDRHSLRYEIIAGYFVMYAYVLFTGSTSVAFAYILPMLPLLVLLHRPPVILAAAAVALALNLIAIGVRVHNGASYQGAVREAEIQIALIALCFLGSYLATRIYDEMYRKNHEYVEQLHSQNAEIQHMTMQTILTIANTIDAKDEYTRGHSKRVAEYAAAIAGEIGMTADEVEDMRSIGLLHDIGKIGIPDAVLNKPGKLTNEEYQVMKSHTVIGGDILKDIGIIDDLEIGARYHHERYDGKGYPDGLAGEAIPLTARVIAVADAYDAMSSNRVYRKHLKPDRIRGELSRGVGTQWDPVCAKAMLRLLDEDRVPSVNPDDGPDALLQASALLYRVIERSDAAAGSEGIDVLTGVYGMQRGNEVISEAIQEIGRGCLFLFDIDHFHRINYEEGFVTGDLYLRTLADVIRSLSDTIVVARYTADAFLAYKPDCEDAVAGASVADLFYERLRERIDADKSLQKLSVSIGITEVATEKDKLDVLYENAGKALYVAKQHGGGRYYCHRTDVIVEGIAEIPATVDLEQLVTAIKSQEMYHGGFNASQPEFGRMYEFLNSLANRTHQNVLVILFTIQSAAGVKAGIEERDRVMDLLEKSIANSIRTVDVMTRYSSTQFAVLFMNLSEDKTVIVTNRIMTDFLRTYDKGEFVIRYDAAELSQVEEVEKI